MNLMQKPGLDLPEASTVSAGAPCSNGKIFFWPLPISGRKMSQKSPNAKGSRNVDPALAITWLVSVTIILLHHFSVTIHFHLASFAQQTTFEKKGGEMLIEQVIEFELKGLGSQAIGVTRRFWDTAPIEMLSMTKL